MAAVLLLAVCLCGIGRLVLRSGHYPASWLAAGMGAVSLVTTVLGVTTAIPFSFLHVALIIAGLVGIIWAAYTSPPSVHLPAAAILLALPLLVILSGGRASQWDEFSNWLPSQLYLIEFDGFPRNDRPPNLSALPAYPYGLPFIGYLVARTLGHFAEHATALFNTTLAAFAGLLIAQLVQEGRRLSVVPSWPLLATGLLAASLLNPAFVPKLVFTAYVDWTTAVVLAIAAVAVWRTLEAALAGDTARTRGDAIAAGLALAALVNLKQANLVLVLLVAIGGAVAWISTRPRHLPDALSLCAILVPAMIVYATWRQHVGTHIRGGDFSFLPLDSWLWDSVWDIAARMGSIAAKKGGYFGLMLVLMFFAARALWRGPDKFGRLAIVTATVFLGYNAFLYVTYVGAFGAFEGRNAASYWRYNTQLGVLAVATAAFGLGQIWKDRLSASLKAYMTSRYVAGLAIGLILLAPLTQLHRIRFDINPAKTYVRQVGSEIKTRLTPGSRLAVIDRQDNGFWALLIRYEVGRAAAVRSLSDSAVSSPEMIRARLQEAPAADFVWVHVPESAIETALGVPLPARQSHFLARNEAGDWRLLQSWPWPAYDDPHRFNE